MFNFVLNFIFYYFDDILTFSLAWGQTVQRKWGQTVYWVYWESLADYLQTCAKMNHGLTTTQARSLAYSYAVKIRENSVGRLPIPESWTNTKHAGVDWLYGFRERNPAISLRVLEPTGIVCIKY
jgi:hypothetical protein